MLINIPSLSFIVFPARRPAASAVGVLVVLVDGKFSCERPCATAVATTLAISSFDFANAQRLIDVHVPC